MAICNNNRLNLDLKQAEELLNGYFKYIEKVRLAPKYSLVTFHSIKNSNDLNQYLFHRYRVMQREFENQFNARNSIPATAFDQGIIKDDRIKLQVISHTKNIDKVKNRLIDGLDSFLENCSDYISLVLRPR